MDQIVKIPYGVCEDGRPCPTIVDPSKVPCGRSYYWMCAMFKKVGNFKPEPGHREAWLKYLFPQYSNEAKLFWCKDLEMSCPRGVNLTECNNDILECPHSEPVGPAESLARVLKQKVK